MGEGEERDGGRGGEGWVRGGEGEGEGSVVMPLIYVFILAELIPIFRQFPLKSLCSCSPYTK